MASVSGLRRQFGRGNRTRGREGAHPFCVRPFLAVGSMAFVAPSLPALAVVLFELSASRGSVDAGGPGVADTAARTRSGQGASAAVEESAARAEPGAL